jgi:hypothetical protein
MEIRPREVLLILIVIFLLLRGGQGGSVEAQRPLRIEKIEDIRKIEGFTEKVFILSENKFFDEKGREVSKDEVISFLKEREFFDVAFVLEWGTLEVFFLAQFEELEKIYGPFQKRDVDFLD